MFGLLVRSSQEWENTHSPLRVYRAETKVILFPSWFPIRNQPWLFGGRQGKGPSVSPRASLPEKQSFSSFCPDGIYSLPIKVVSLGRSAGFGPHLLFPFQHKIEIGLFSLERILALSQGQQEKHCATTPENHKDTKELWYFLESQTKAQADRGHPEGRYVSAFFGRNPSLYSVASDTPRIVGCVNPIPRQCKFPLHCMWF